MKKVSKFEIYVLLLCVCMNFVGCSLENNTDESGNIFYKLIVEKAAQVVEKDTFEDGDIYVDSICYGNYSQSEKPEMLVLCKFNSNVHVAGLDRTFAMIFDVASMDLIAYKNFDADEVILQNLPTEEISKILFLGKTTYSGMTTQYIEIFSIQDNEWIVEPLEGVTLQGNELCYLLDDNQLMVVTQKNGDYPTEMLIMWDEQVLYSWNEHTGCFELTDI